METETKTERLEQVSVATRLTADLSRWQQVVVIENSVAGFFISNPDGLFIEVNPAFARMLGYDSPKQLVEEITDVATQLYVHSAQRSVLQDLLQRRGVIRSVEFQARRRDGSTIWLAVSARAVRSASGQILHYEGVAEDVTDRKNADAKLRQANQALEQHARQLEIANADLQQFAYAVSHDLKEPLRLVSSYLTLLSLRHQDQLDEEGKDSLAVAVLGAKKMKGLIEDLLAYSMIGATESVREEVDVRDVVEDVLKRFQPQIQEASCIVTVGYLPVLRGVRSHLNEVFTQLIENALKFRRDDVPCQITIQASRKQEHWVFQVEDNCIGIDVRHLNRVFQIFQRAHNKERYLGNGMGLAKCKKIVEMHGGRIWLDSALAEGSTFCFTLPTH